MLLPYGTSRTLEGEGGETLSNKLVLHSFRCLQNALSHCWTAVLTLVHFSLFCLVCIPELIVTATVLSLLTSLTQLERMLLCVVRAKCALFQGVPRTLWLRLPFPSPSAWTKFDRVDTPERARRKRWHTRQTRTCKGAWGKAGRCRQIAMRWCSSVPPRGCPHFAFTPLVTRGCCTVVHRGTEPSSAGDRRRERYAAL